MFVIGTWTSLETRRPGARFVDFRFAKVRPFSVRTATLCFGPGRLSCDGAGTGFGTISLNLTKFSRQLPSCEQSAGQIQRGTRGPRLHPKQGAKICREAAQAARRERSESRLSHRERAYFRAPKTGRRPRELALSIRLLIQYSVQVPAENSFRRDSRQSRHPAVSLRPEW